ATTLFFSTLPRPPPQPTLFPYTTLFRSGLQPNKLSKSVKGTQGVYAVQVTGFVNPAELVASEVNNQKKQMQTTKAQRSWSSIYQSLQNKADIDDNRIRFY